MAAAPAVAQDGAVLDAVRAGSVTFETVIVPPPPAPLPDGAAGAQEFGGGADMFNTGIGTINADEEAVINNKLFPLKEAKWPGSVAPVCWENPGADAADAEARGWVQSAVLETWSAHSAMRFPGRRDPSDPEGVADVPWKACEPNSIGIRIRIADEGPHVKQLGKFLNGMPDGMVLNFTFARWSTACQTRREFCIKAVAVHEFGHAMGFAHEHNRPDVPGECTKAKQGPDGNDIALTPYDPESAMNYCGPRWNGGGQLSALDIKGVQSWYGLPVTAVATGEAPAGGVP